ncbi:aminotransferase-like protein [Panicum miliaceum]|uniref:Aminotransferase-like protein n=1 Tax=Panicum miliaceum TaxID=4540 RepID=A0A3L6TGF8_PANMI|nr:aminotransferase-like protein [Panicum miliaceum]
MMKELEAVKVALAEEENRLEQLPSAIEKMKTDMKAPIREAICLHKLIKPIPRPADDDKQKINDIDQIRLHAISVIQNRLGSA